MRSTINVVIKDVAHPDAPDTGTEFTVAATSHSNNTGITNYGATISIVLACLLLGLVIVRSIASLHHKKVVNTFGASRHKNTKSKLATYFGFLILISSALTWPISSILSSEPNTHAATPFIDITTEDTTVTINRIAGESASAVVPVEVILNEDLPNGYDLYAYGLNGTSLKSSDTDQTIDMVRSEDSALSSNTWSIIGGATSVPSAADAVWRPLGDNTSTSTFLSQNVKPTANGDIITLYIGVSIDANLPTGTYTNEIEYETYYPALLSGNKTTTIPNGQYTVGPFCNIDGARYAPAKTIRMADSLPANFIANDTSTISLAESKYPIYAFYDNATRTMYVYTESKRIVMAPNGEDVFAALTGCRFVGFPSGLETWSVFDLTDITALADWDTSNVTNMRRMFSNNASLTNLSGLENWDTSNVTNMDDMFLNNTSLTDASAINDWDINKVTSFNSMFDRAPSHPDFTKRPGTWDSQGTFYPQ